MREHPVEPVQMALILHQGGAGQVVEILDAAFCHAGLHGTEQGKIFRDRRRHLRLSQCQDEMREHGPDLSAPGQEGEAFEQMHILFVF